MIYILPKGLYNRITAENMYYRVMLVCYMQLRAWPVFEMLSQITFQHRCLLPVAARHVAAVDAQSQFDQFYAVASQLLDAFYPECSITVTSRDPSYMTGYLKAVCCAKRTVIT